MAKEVDQRVSQRIFEHLLQLRADSRPGSIGTMAAQVKSGGADQFQFIAAGSPPDDKGLQFMRIKSS